MRRFRRALALCAMAGAVLAGAPISAADWKPGDDDALLFDARLGQYRLGEGIRGYQTPSGVCVDLGDMVSALDVPIGVDKAKGVASGWAFDERNQLKIDRIAGKVRVADRQTSLQAGTIRDTREGWCVQTAALSAWLGIELQPDLANAVLLISSKHKLPVELAAERRARAGRVRPQQTLDLAKLPQAKLAYEIWRTPSLDAVVTIGGLADKRRGKELDRHWELYASGEIAQLSVDARLSSSRRGLPSDLRVRAYRSDVGANLLGPLHATHFAVGDVSSFGSALAANSMSGRGAIVTNRPLDRQDTFDRKTFRGELPSGWDAEIYRNGQLLQVAQDRRDGRYEFLDVPLLYGQNRFEIVLYGPQGQVRRIREAVAVGAESIPPKQTYYWAGVTEDERDIFRFHKNLAADGRGWRGSAGVERGIDTRTSLSAQIHSLMIQDERLTYVEGAVRRSVGPAVVEIAGSFETKGGFAARAQVLAQFGETYVSAESIVARNKFFSDRVNKGVVASHIVGLDHSFDLGKIVLPVHVEGRYIQRDNGNDQLEAGARVSATIDRISLTGAVDLRRQRSGYGPSPPDSVEAALLANGAIGKTRLRGEARWRLSPESRFESATLIGQRQIGEHTDIRGEIGYESGLGRGRAGLAYVRRFDKFALSLSGEAATDGSVAAGLNLAFSLGPDPRGRGVRVTADKLAAAGTTLARVFHDENGDGLRQYSEPLAKDVQLMVGRTPIEKLTDARGAAIIDGLAPHQPVLIGIDGSSLADPLTQPSGPGIVVTPRAGLAVVIDLPLVSAGEALGTLTGPGGRTLEGVDLELVDGRGIVAAVTRSDFDGFFQFESVAYGNYTLRIAKLSADALKLSPALPQQVRIGGKTPSVRLGRVIAENAGPGISIAARK